MRGTLELIDETVQPRVAAVCSVDERGRVTSRGMLSYPDGTPTDRLLEIRDTRESDLDAVATALADVPMVMAEQLEDGKAQLGTGRHGIAVATAMRLEGRLAGFLVLDDPRSGRALAADDVDLLTTISDQLAVALENAEAYRTIHELNADLGRKNDALESANFELRDAQGQLVRQERLAAVGELSAAVAHGLRNPLASIRAAAQVAAMQTEEETVTATLADVVAGADHMNARITDLLDFSRPFEPRALPISLGDAITGVLERSAAAAAGRGVELRFLDDGAPERVAVDPAMFEQALTELVGNAIDASHAGGTVLVSAGASVANGTGGVWLEVLDRGSGIRQTGNAEEIFELFFTTKSAGTGFGLATAKKIVERHGGTISAVNRAQGGACFRIELPAASVV